MQTWSFAAAVVACLASSLVSGESQAAGQGRSCGATTGVRCDKGLWCEPRPGRCSDRRADGRCRRVPAFCTMIYQPVCGCDGKTYSNDCVRRSERIGKRHGGPC